jgi:hypothetical protein
VTQVTGKLVDSLGNPLTDISTGPIRQGEIDVKVPGEETTIELLQPTVSIPTDLPQLDRPGLIKSSLEGNENPPFIDGTKVFASRTSDYGLEILINGKPAKPELRDGAVFVPISRGETYEVRLVNRSKFDAAAKVSIDGLNTFAFSDMRNPDGPRKGQPRYDTWIVGPGQSAVVPGWHKRDKGPGNINKFRVTSYAESAAAILKQETDVGTIQAIFSAAWPAGQDPPAELNEPQIKRRGLPDATGIGPPASVALQPIKRDIGVVRASISIRYSIPRED